MHFVTADQEFTFKNKKLLALYGPPGTGKSTLARVVAKLCGYAVREINASDTRSPDELIKIIKAAAT